MSVLIKGMKMPKSCFFCEMCYQEQDSEHCVTSRCAAQEHKEIFPDKSLRNDDCPLVEIKPHGRLIDADAFRAEYFCGDKFPHNMVYVTVEQVLNRIDESPTIIEAEYPPSITFDEMWESLKKQDTFFVEVEEEAKRLKEEGGT